MNDNGRSVSHVPAPSLAQFQSKNQKVRKVVLDFIYAYRAVVFTRGKKKLLLRGLTQSSVNRLGDFY